MVRLTLLVSLVCLTSIALGYPMNDDLETALEHHHDHSHHDDTSDSSEDLQDLEHHHDHSHHDDTSDSSEDLQDLEHHHDHSHHDDTSDSSEERHHTVDSSDDSSDDSHHHHHHHLSQGIDLTNGTCLEKAERLLKYLWKRYKARFGIQVSAEKEAKWRANFKNALERIQVHNCEADMGLQSFKQGLTSLSCLAPEEVAQMNGFKVGQNRNSKNEFRATVHQSQLPTAFSWVNSGGVSRVKNQGSCGSCYSFSATGAVEFQKWKITNTLTEASEQNIVDCSSKFGNHGCDGGRPDASFRYIQKNDGIDTEQSYQYTGQVGPCRYNPANKLKNITICGAVNVKSNDPTALLQALTTKGPISVAMDAGQPGIQNYKTGVYKCTKKVQLNHAVLLVGYDAESYHIKNSWGTQWGESGYIRISRDAQYDCGIPKDAAYPCAAAA